MYGIQMLLQIYQFETTTVLVQWLMDILIVKIAN